jgi:hypothetical protein
MLVIRAKWLVGPNGKSFPRASSFFSLGRGALSYLAAVDGNGGVAEVARERRLRHIVAEWPPIFAVMHKGTDVC